MSERDDQTLARLLQLAGRSEPIDEHIERRVYEAVHKEWVASSQPPDDSRVYRNVRREWSRSSSRSRVRRWVFPLAMAAAAVLAVAVILQPAPTTMPNVPLGEFVRVADATGSGHRIGDAVRSGDTVTSGPSGGVSVLLASGESVRLDRDTTVVFADRDRLRLLDGRVYADTGNYVYRDRALVVETANGTVTDVGTQFSVDARGASLDVAVREGRVDVRNDGQELVAVAGERLLIEPGQGVKVHEISPHDDYWGWVSELAPAYEIENRSLLDFLRWAARETGRELVFEDSDLRMAAMRTDLHGSVEDFDPDAAISAVLSTTSFRYQVAADRIVINRN
ncbi:MAG: FecR family protein [Woeseiaceae bacterium]|jgi:ferric-dicitrate binding protein FerR (iron transport regulator)